MEPLPRRFQVGARTHISTLLERPIFDPEIRGGVCNFITAKCGSIWWQAGSGACLDGGGLSGSAQSILSAFETAKYGESFVYPATRPIAAWLAQMEQMEKGGGEFFPPDAEIRAGHAMLTYGDPFRYAVTNFEGKALQSRHREQNRGAIWKPKGSTISRWRRFGNARALPMW